MLTLQKTAVASVLTLVAALAGTNVFAADAVPQTTSAAPAMHRPHPDQQARFAEFKAKKEAEIHDLLKITPEQEGAWKAFLSRVTPPPQDHSAPPRPHTVGEAPTAPQMLEHKLERLQKEEARVRAFLDATKELYAVLTPDQRKLADYIYRQHAKEGHHDHHGHGSHGAWGAQPPAPPAQ
jgi:protein CpxP